MNLLPKASGNRPRVACEIFPGGVVAGRSPEPAMPLASVAKVELPPHAVVPSLKPGNIADRVAVVAAVRGALEAIGMRANARGADMTLIIPDAAVRVLLLDFDTLPTKLSEALPIVRFRLKKLVPFDADEAMISFQLMSSTRSMVRVLAVAIPRDVLLEYESMAREAGFEPGAVLPSTLAALAALGEREGASLVVNAHEAGVTTAIVRDGVLLLHRAMELTEYVSPVPANLPAELFESTAMSPSSGSMLPLVDREASKAEWAAQKPLPEHGRNPYADRIDTEIPAQNQDAITELPVTYGNYGAGDGDARFVPRPEQGIELYANEAVPSGRSPYASPLLQEQLDAEFHKPTYVAPSTLEALAPEPVSMPEVERYHFDEEPEPLTHLLAPDARSEEIARAVSVAVAYFEDSLSVAPEVLLSAGPLGAESLQRTLEEGGLAQENGLRVREVVDAAALAAGAATSAVPRSWMAGITGALRS